MGVYVCMCVSEIVKCVMYSVIVVCAIKCDGCGVRVCGSVLVGGCGWCVRHTTSIIKNAGKIFFLSKSLPLPSCGTKDLAAALDAVAATEMGGRVPDCKGA